ncbi:MAG: phospholipid/cholesterol/gamma-HCH transport system substrate-binding protein [Solirubrobacterales bacterium]|jgi:ABC-type transporter Mla subunit MlaD|nr:phospholipid/cholesterol/gamma-HCH transport system substrate-binding protein [Solirubrobacterales bacterium]
MTRPNHNRRLSNAQIGLIAVALTLFGFYLAFTKTIPFAGHGYQLKAVFQDAQNIRAKSPVRISGVDIGQVSDIQHLTDANGRGEDAAVVTMDLQDSALPVRQDATLQLRPRLFLEGNLFVDLHPGSPSAPELNSGSVVPETQTSNSVQFDQVLTSLQAPVRTDLQIFLKEFGGALDKYGGAKGFQESFRTSPAAYEYTSQVNQALLGTQPGDLAGFVSNLGIVTRELNQNATGLQGLITNLNTVSGDFAAHQASLRDAIVELPRVLAVGRPALFKLNQDFPALRAFAREALPGTKAANQALDYANPWIGQLRQLVSKGELRGLVDDLRPTVPDLAALTNASLPFLEQSRSLASCFNNVVIPWSNTPIPNNDSDPPAAKVYQETAYGLTGVAGESRSGDANGQEFRVLGGGGTNTIAPFSTPDLAAPLTGVTPFNFIGSEPAKQSSAKTPFRPDVPCETQDPPNLHSEIGPAPATSSSGRSATYESPDLKALTTRYGQILSQFAQAKQLKAAGSQTQAKQLYASARQQYASWTKDWTAYQRANGVKVSPPETPPKGATH